MREVFEGSGALRFTCESVGSPAPNITWYVNGQPINPISGVSTVGNTLTIASPLVSNSGVYQCIVSNRFGDDQRAWLLEIRKTGEPQILPHPPRLLPAFQCFTRKTGDTWTLKIWEWPWAKLPESYLKYVIMLMVILAFYVLASFPPPSPYLFSYSESYSDALQPHSARCI